MFEIVSLKDPDLTDLSDWLVRMPQWYVCLHTQFWDDGHTYHYALPSTWVLGNQPYAHKSALLLNPSASPLLTLLLPDNFKHCFILCIHGWVHMSSACNECEGDISLETALAFNSVGPWDWPKVFRLGSKSTYLSSILLVLLLLLIWSTWKTYPWCGVGLGKRPEGRGAKSRFQHEPRQGLYFSPFPWVWSQFNFMSSSQLLRPLQVSALTLPMYKV